MPDNVAEVLHVLSWEVQSGGLFKTRSCHDCPWGTSDIAPPLAWEWGNSLPSCRSLDSYNLQRPSNHYLVTPWSIWLSTLTPLSLYTN